MQVRVQNKQQYAVARGGHVFPPLATVEVEVKGDKRLAEITACVYLKVAPVAPLPAAGTLDAESLSKAELLALAADAGVEASERMTKAQIADAIAAVPAADDEPEDEPGDEMSE